LEQSQSTIALPMTQPLVEGKVIKRFLIGILFAAPLGLFAGKDTFVSSLAAAGLVPMAFFLLAGLASFAQDRVWAKVLTVLYFGFLMLCLAIISAILIGMVENSGSPSMEAKDWVFLKEVGILFCLALVMATLAALPQSAALFSKYIPGFVSTRFSDRIAMAACACLPVLFSIPLIVLGEPLYFALHNAGVSIFSERTFTQDSMILWAAPIALLVVGYGDRRSLPEALNRLGLCLPSRQQIALGIGLGMGMYAMVQLFSYPIDRIWEVFGWPTTSEEAIKNLMPTSVIAALIALIGAGIWEELVFRGLLQPKVGILGANLVFCFMHAHQYNWDVLLIVFFGGLGLGRIRQRYNTPTAMMSHAVYNVAVWFLFR
jgi:membrane protease YdiL (CAAX protease family)